MRDISRRCSNLCSVHLPYAQNRLSVLLQLSFSRPGFLSGMSFLFCLLFFHDIRCTRVVVDFAMCEFKEYNLVPKNKLSNILIHNSFQWETLVSRSFPELGVGYYFDVNLLFFWICLGPFWFKSPFGVVSLFELKMFTVILK